MELIQWVEGYSKNSWCRNMIRRQSPLKTGRESYGDAIDICNLEKKESSGSDLPLSTEKSAAACCQTGIGNPVFQVNCFSSWEMAYFSCLPCKGNFPSGMTWISAEYIAVSVANPWAEILSALSRLFCAHVRIELCRLGLEICASTGIILFYKWAVSKTIKNNINESLMWEY